MATRTYRPDVDGLRGVAIVLVLLFHGTKICPGGFIGVDVFFTISGFLITGLLLDEQQRGGIRIVDFWIRRVRRLLPAATLMVLATLVAGFFIMFPEDYDALAKSAVAQQLFSSNVYFWRKAEYFDGSAELKPLLHTWSLAVEEQFYVAYPLLLMLLGRLPRHIMAASLLMMAAASLGISDWGVRAYPQMAFYLLPSRAWEILLGGLICFAPPPPPKQPSREPAGGNRPAWDSVLRVGFQYRNAISGTCSPSALRQHGSADLRQLADQNLGGTHSGDTASGLRWPDLLFALSLALAPVELPGLSPMRRVAR